MYGSERNSRENPKMDTMFEDMFTSSLGIRGLFNRFKNKAVLKGYHYIKDRFGFEYIITDQQMFKDISTYFKDACGVEIFNDNNTNKFNLFPNINIDKVFVLDENTIVYISWEGSSGKGESYHGYMYIFGKKSYKHYSYIYKNIIDVSLNGRDDSTIIYTIYANPERDDWQGIRKSAPARPFNTLYFDNDIEEKIKLHIDSWMKNKEIYRSRGITFKTGILLYGSPGTGKSSIAAAVADYMNCNIIMIDTSTFKDLNVNEVTASINADDRMYVVLLDDIDTILTKREDEKATTEDKANIAKLLGFLDSSNSPDNVIFIATTNHIDLFDSAIKRAGRFDKIIEVGDIHKSKGTPMRMCKGFGLSDKSARDLLDTYKTDKINPADLQVKILEAIKTNIMGE